MRREAVSSSVIASIGYDADSQVLEVEFHSGELYRYLGVPEFDVARLKRAESMGRFLNEWIKPRYEFVYVAPR
ncbi:KTSC domain-containing protein [Phytoactinopolyspora mesophila]|uniref:KTSC domain-containing protein n=1 Tax=Phytoactinopolyspora mesophila TaxID=2650750 RepID=A0A7K3M1A9_9ACTN|nr:KTSC domain-containing protein [Phytoactinopolyspora mesophila]NDL56827.1 KTSC domain-containing protein [Phytoactinopolyspora mesophila]